MLNLKTVLSAALLAGAVGLALPAAAMPFDGRGPAVEGDGAARIEQARWLCGPYGCRWAPNHYPRYGYGPRWGYGPHWGQRPVHARRWEGGGGWGQRPVQERRWEGGPRERGGEW
jgi:hypothetical protein